MQNNLKLLVINSTKINIIFSISLMQLQVKNYITASIDNHPSINNKIYLSSCSSSFIDPSTEPPLCKGCVHGFSVKERVSHI